MEDSQCGCDHRKNDETASKVDAAQEDLGDPYTNFDLLLEVSYLLERINSVETYNIFGLLLL